MKFKVFWKDIEFLEVDKINDVYYSRLIGENIDKVIDEGYPVTFLINIKVMDNELPKLIQSRLPSIEYIEEKISKKDDIEKAIIEYINNTKCRRVTDYLSMEIEE